MITAARLYIEAKKSKKEADMDKDCEEAVGQMITKKYAEGLYGYTQIFCYGISFFSEAGCSKGENLVMAKCQQLHN